MVADGAADRVREVSDGTTPGRWRSLSGAATRR
jgi:hypothetical protein